MMVVAATDLSADDLVEYLRGLASEIEQRWIPGPNKEAVEQWCAEYSYNPNEVRANEVTA